MSAAGTQAPAATRRRPAARQRQSAAGVRPRRQWKKVGLLLVAVFTFLHVPARGFAQDTHLLVITGVGGDEEHTKNFHKWASAMIETAKKKDGLPDDDIIYLSEKPELDPAHIKGKSTKEGVEKAFSDIAQRAHPNDAVFIILIGHGSFDGHQAAFNLPGPDLTAADFARLLGKLATERVAFVNTASSSGAFLPTVAGAGRVIVTATKTGGERNETRFPEFFVEAFNDDTADRDRNGRVSIAEAFEYAKSRVTKAFEQQGLLMTEHAALDEGPGTGLAASLFLAAPQGTLKVDTSDPAVRALADQRDAIEKQIAALKLMKPSMDEAKYTAQMEKLLTDLAMKTKEIRDLQTKKDRDR